MNTAVTSNPRSGREAAPRWRRLRAPLLVALAVIAAAVIAALATPPTTSGDLDPNSGAPGGSRALARILERQGVVVNRVRRAADATASAGISTGTLVVVHPELLTPAELTGLAGRAALIVLVAPDAVALRALAPKVVAQGDEPAVTVQPGCPLPAAQVGAARAGGYVYSLAGAPGAPDPPTGTTTDAGFPDRSSGAVGQPVAALPDGQVCYPPDPARPGTGSLVVLAGAGPGRDVAVLGQPDVLRNGHLDADADAALALRLLGTRATLTWLLPDPLGAGPAAPTSLRALLPGWVGWTTLQVGVALLLLLLWRGRRLGPLVQEPLPVVVRSSEALLGRARLYRRARAVDRAAATLRTATLRRLAGRLAVPPSAGPDAVAVRAAEAIGQDLQQVRRVLLGGPPTGEKALVRLADELDDLERGVAGGPGRVRQGHDRHREGQQDRQSDEQQREGHG